VTEEEVTVVASLPESSTEELRSQG
jgi:hypothetical protein